MKRLPWSAITWALVWIGVAGCAAAPAREEAPRYVVSWPEAGRRLAVSAAELESWGARTVTSAYFDRALGYRDSRFTALPFETLLKRHDPGVADAVLLNCFDDYQGLIALEDIRRYRLMLATRIHLQPGIRPPDWLNPLLILVPDGSEAPFVERFLTANIREVSFVNRERYYAPLNAVVRRHPKTAPGWKLYQDNCVYCHSLGGVGGNKGGPLAARFDFARPEDRRRFERAFLAFHQNNPDKQNVAQFLPPGALEALADFLQRAAGS